MLLRSAFQQKLKLALGAKGWSQSDLARALGMSRQLIGDYALGRKCPGLAVVERFAAVLDLKPWNLVDDKPLAFLTPQDSAVTARMGECT